MAMTDEQIERYSRHIILKEVGAKGQKKLLKGKVLIIGAGGLGAPAAMYLAAAGVGTIGIVDADEVDLSNLQRQIIHSTTDIGKAKVKSAKETMNAMNPDVEVTITKNILHENVDYTPYEGIKVKGWPVMTMVRGQVVVENERLQVPLGFGRYIYRKPVQYTELLK